MVGKVSFRLGLSDRLVERLPIEEKSWHSIKNVVVALPRMARQGEVIPLTEDLNAEESLTNEPHEQTNVFIGTSFLAALGDRTQDI